MTPELSPQDAERLAAIFRDAFGWEVPPEMRTTIELRLRRRLAELSLPAFSDYVWLLTYDRRRGEELQHVADLLTTRETYFFREQYQLKAFADEILPALSKPEKKLRVWSAGCASGEEAYTLAILALESAAMKDWEIDI